MNRHWDEGIAPIERIKIYQNGRIIQNEMFAYSNL